MISAAPQRPEGLTPVQYEALVRICEETREGALVTDPMDVHATSLHALRSHKLIREEMKTLWRPTLLGVLVYRGEADIPAEASLGWEDVDWGLPNKMIAEIMNVGERRVAKERKARGIPANGREYRAKKRDEILSRIDTSNMTIREIMDKYDWSEDAIRKSLERLGRTLQNGGYKPSYKTPPQSKLLDPHDPEEHLRKLYDKLAPHLEGGRTLQASDIRAITGYKDPRTSLTRLCEDGRLERRKHGTRWVYSLPEPVDSLPAQGVVG